MSKILGRVSYFVKARLHNDTVSKPPPGWLSWDSAGLLSGRSRVRTPAGATLRVFK